MNMPDVNTALEGVDNLMQAHAHELQRMKEAFAYRMQRLDEDREREKLNPLLRKRIDVAKRRVSEARSVHDSYSRMLTALLRFSRSTLVSQQAAPAAAVPLTIREFSQLYTLLGYANVAKTQVLATVALREILESGKLAEATPRLKALLRVGGEVAADEAIKYSGADSAQNMVKVVKVLADSRAAMNVSVKSLQDVSSWLDLLDSAEDSLQEWMRTVQGDLENIERNIQAIV